MSMNVTGGGDRPELSTPRPQTIEQMANRITEICGNAALGSVHGYAGMQDVNCELPQNLNLNDFQAIYNQLPRDSSEERGLLQAVAKHRFPSSSPLSDANT